MVLETTELESSFRQLSPEEKVSKFNEFESMYQDISGQVLCEMREDGVHIELGFNDFADFVDAELTISSKTSTDRISDYLSKLYLSFNSNITIETESNLKKKNRWIPDEDIEEYHSLSDDLKKNAIETSEYLGKKALWHLHELPREIVVGLKNKKYTHDVCDELLVSKRLGRFTTEGQVIKKADELMFVKARGVSIRNAEVQRDEELDVRNYKTIKVSRARVSEAYSALVEEVFDGDYDKVYSAIKAYMANKRRSDV